MQMNINKSTYVSSTENESQLSHKIFHGCCRGRERKT